MIVECMEKRAGKWVEGKFYEVQIGRDSNGRYVRTADDEFMYFYQADQALIQGVEATFKIHE